MMYGLTPERVGCGTGIHELKLVAIELSFMAQTALISPSEVDPRFERFE
jgi:hypothetical protein